MGVEPTVKALQAQVLATSLRYHMVADIGFGPIQTCFRDRGTTNYANPLYLLNGGGCRLRSDDSWVKAKFVSDYNNPHGGS